MQKNEDVTNKIVGIPEDLRDRLLVQKSRPLYSLWKSNLTLVEFKILDVYLSRINSRDPNRRDVRFSKGELEKILGVTRINAAELKIWLKHLMGNVVEINDVNKPSSFCMVTLFERAFATQDEYGIWQIDLTCTNASMEYFFNVENLGYFRYKLRSVTALNSRYSYILFLYLEQNRSLRLKWSIDLSELKSILRCDTETTYQQFKFFNQRILAKSCQEINEKTECKFTYTPIKKGRTVIAIQFELKNIIEILDNYEKSQDELPVPSESNNKLSLELPEVDSKTEDMKEMLMFLNEACEMEFTINEMERIFKTIVLISDQKLPYVPGMGSDIKFQRFHYLTRKYAAFKVECERRKITSRLAYFIRMLENDIDDADVENVIEVEDPLSTSSW